MFITESMSAPLLATKLYIPPPRPNVVLRPRLSERLTEGLHRKLTLISAPAGFGKSTLLGEWFASRTEGRGPRAEVAESLDPVLSPQSSSLVEPLSQRKLEVLQPVAQGLSNHEISERLFLALNTVKGHNRS